LAKRADSKIRRGAVALFRTVAKICRKIRGSGSVRASHQTVSGASKN